jgi:hypothetical protein
MCAHGLGSISREERTLAVVLILQFGIHQRRHVDKCSEYGQWLMPQTICSYGHGRVHLGQRFDSLQRLQGSPNADGSSSYLGLCAIAIACCKALAWAAAKSQSLV